MIGLDLKQGCGSDIPGHWYSLSRAPNPRWNAYYAGQPEIRAYWEELWASRGLRAHTRFGTEVVRTTWDAQSQTYAVVLEDVVASPSSSEESGSEKEQGQGGGRGGQRTVTAKVVLSAIGGFLSPRVPEDLPGVDTFQGDQWHSAAWRHDVPLSGKRIGVIGNGCSAWGSSLPHLSPM